MHDASGRAVALPFVSRRSLDKARWATPMLVVIAAIVLAGAIGFRSGVVDAVAYMIAVALISGFVAYTWLRTQKKTREVSDADRTRQLRDALSAIELSPIGDAKAGRARIRGTVHVLRGVHDGLAAVFQRVRETHKWMVEVVHDDQLVSEEMRETTITDTSECGRFAVVDDTGVAIVDDDAFVIWSLKQKLAAYEGGALALRDGAEVEIIGPATKGVAPEAASLVRESSSSYRSGRSDSALLFDGTPDDRVWIVVQ